MLEGYVLQLITGWGRFLQVPFSIIKQIRGILNDLITFYYHHVCLVLQVCSCTILWTFCMRSLVIVTNRKKTEVCYGETNITHTVAAFVLSRTTISELVHHCGIVLY